MQTLQLDVTHLKNWVASFEIQRACFNFVSWSKSLTWGDTFRFLKTDQTKQKMTKTNKQHFLNDIV